MPITFPLSPLTVVVEIALGVDPASDPAGWSWTNITSFVRYAPGIRITKGRRDESSRVDPASARLTLDNRDGRFCRRNPVGAYYGQLSKNTPIRIGVNPGTGTTYRFHGFVNEWPTRWSKDARDSTVPITCAGILRRLARSRRLGSALYRSISGIAANDYVPLAYWPCEDGSGATSIASGLAGGTPMSVSGGVQFASASGLEGSDSLPVFPSGSSALAVIPTYTDTGQWVLQFVMKIDAKPASNTNYLEIRLKGNNDPRLVVQLRPDPVTSDLLLVAYTSAGVQDWGFGIPIGSAFSQISDADFFGHWFMYTVLLYPDALAPPGNYAISFGFADNEGGALFNSLFEPGSPGQPTSVQILGAANFSIGHMALFVDANFDPATDGVANANAVHGWAGETAADRMTRVCREEGVSFTTAATTSAAMGAQQNGTLLDVLRDCENADQGLLYEDQFGLGYLAASQRYNLATTLALDFNSGDIAEPPEPADDDQQTVNSYTASRSGGSSATDQDDDSISTDGLYASSGTFNVEADTQLPDIASWRVHLGTVDEDRWPAIPIRLARTPNRITAWTAMTIGGRMTVANPPSQRGASDAIDAIVEGWTETITPHMWEAILNTSPAQPFEAFTVADQVRGRLDTDGSALVAAVSSGATSITVTPTQADKPLWITTANRPQDFPFDVGVGGERQRVTAIASAVLDDLNRVASNGWGGNWSIVTGSAADFSASGSSGWIALPTANVDHIIKLPLAYADMTLYASGIGTTAGVIPVGSDAFFAVYGRYQGTGDYVAAELTYHPGDSVELKLYQLKGFAFTQFGATTLPFLGSVTAWDIELQIVGTTALARAYKTGTPAPKGWLLRGTTTLTGTGDLAVAAKRFTGNTTAATYLVNSVEVRSPQIFTVTRSINGVIKAQTAGTAVSLWKPAVIAL